MVSFPSFLPGTWEQTPSHTYCSYQCLAGKSHLFISVKNLSPGAIKDTIIHSCLRLHPSSPHSSPPLIPPLIPIFPSLLLLGSSPFISCPLRYSSPLISRPFLYSPLLPSSSPPFHATHAHGLVTRRGDGPPRPVQTPAHGPVQYRLDWVCERRMQSCRLGSWKEDSKQDCRTAGLVTH